MTIERRRTRWYKTDATRGTERSSSFFSPRHFALGLTTSSSLQNVRLKVFTFKAADEVYGASTAASILLARQLDCLFLSEHRTAEPSVRAEKDSKSVAMTSRSSKVQKAKVLKPMQLLEMRPLARQEHFRHTLYSLADNSFSTHPQIRRILDNESDVW
jgi:hypothetical protein